MTTTRLREWIERSLEQRGEPPLAEIVAERRQAGDSWQDVAYLVRLKSGESVTNVTLSSWFADTEPAAS